MRQSERGSTTLIAATAAAAFMVLALIVFDATGELLARHRAWVSADLSAVTAATALWFGDDPCVAAAGTAALNAGGELQECNVDGMDVTVLVAVSGATGRARAGPL
ncbi:MULTISPECIES: Rv3654c family TadE-like protein [unclassified Corynebacterium]|uniref:Rv3654c family TadE-like protein n=1 Tax=unclassified Corynebacterium TaxID=2624378 RepID=UPI003523D03D